MTEIVKNLVVKCVDDTKAYICTVDLWDDWSQSWETNVPYVARAGDPAPVNVWIIEQIGTGEYDPIDACPLPPPPAEQVPGSGPVIS
jgi:hypothetical protein